MPIRSMVGRPTVIVCVKPACLVVGEAFQYFTWAVMSRSPASLMKRGREQMIEDGQDNNSVMATAESLRQRLLEAVSPESPESLVRLCSVMSCLPGDDGIQRRATAATPGGRYGCPMLTLAEGRLEMATDAGEVPTCWALIL